MQLGGRFGGHIVSGHIDATGKILGIREDDNACGTGLVQIIKY